VTIATGFVGKEEKRKDIGLPITCCHNAFLRDVHISNLISFDIGAAATRMRNLFRDEGELAAKSGYVVAALLKGTHFWPSSFGSSLW
jgi:hypothetical protein